MTENRDEEISHAQGAALAAYALSTSTLRLLHETGTFSAADVEALVTGILQSLERDNHAADPAAHAARSLLSALADDLGVPLKHPS